MNNYEILMKVRSIVLDIAVIIYASHLCNDSLSIGRQQPWLFVVSFVLTALALPFLLVNLLILCRHVLPLLRRVALQFMEEE